MNLKRLFGLDYSDRERERKQARYERMVGFSEEGLSGSSVLSASNPFRSFGERGAKTLLEHELGDGEGRSVAVEDQLRDVVGVKGDELITRERALCYSVYERAVTGSAEHAATLICESVAEERTRRVSYEVLKRKGFSDRNNKYGFWVNFMTNVQIDSVAYAEIVGPPVVRRLVPHPRNCVFPFMEGGELFFRVTKNFINEWGVAMKEERVLGNDQMVVVYRPNTNRFYQNTSKGPVYSKTLEPVPTYEILSDVIRLGLAIDRWERGFWESDATLKSGMVISEKTDTKGDPLESLRDMVASNRVHAPIRLVGDELSLTSVRGMEDYHETVHKIKDDCEARIATKFGGDPSTLGSDAARTGAGASQLSESEFRQQVLPLVNAVKYEIEQKLLGGTALNVPNMRYFVSVGNLSKLAQGLSGLVSKNEARKYLYDMGPMDGGEELFEGAQSPRSGVSESNNEEGENM